MQLKDIVGRKISIEQCQQQISNSKHHNIINNIFSLVVKLFHPGCRYGDYSLSCLATQYDQCSDTRVNSTCCHTCLVLRERYLLSVTTSSPGLSECRLFSLSLLKLRVHTQHIFNSYLAKCLGFGSVPQRQNFV